MFMPLKMELLYQISDSNESLILNYTNTFNRNYEYLTHTSESLGNILELKTNATITDRGVIISIPVSANVTYESLQKGIHKIYRAASLDDLLNENNVDTITPDNLLSVSPDGFATFKTNTF